MNDKIQLAAMGEHMAEQSMCMAKRIEELEAQARVMAGLLREAQRYVRYRLEHTECDARIVMGLIFDIDAALSGKLPAQHQDDAAVDRFAIAMKAKMAAAREKGRGGWDDPNACSVEFLADLLVGHVGKGNQGNFEDIANLAMMLHQRGADPAVLASKKQVMALPKGWSVTVHETSPRYGIASISGPGVFEMMMPVSYSMLDFFKAMAAAEHAVPEGWQLVSVEPSVQELVAMRDAWSDSPYSNDLEENLLSGWQAVLAAAPKPEAK